MQQICAPKHTGHKQRNRNEEGGGLKITEVLLGMSQQQLWGSEEPLQL